MKILHQNYSKLRLKGSTRQYSKAMSYFGKLITRIKGLTRPIFQNKNVVWKIDRTRLKGSTRPTFQNKKTFLGA